MHTLSADFRSIKKKKLTHTILYSHKHQVSTFVQIQKNTAHYTNKIQRKEIPTSTLYKKIKIKSNVKYKFILLRNTDNHSPFSFSLFSILIFFSLPYVQYYIHNWHQTKYFKTKYPCSHACCHIKPFSFFFSITEKQWNTKSRD